MTQISSRQLSGAPVSGTTTCVPTAYAASLTYTADDGGVRFLSPVTGPATCELRVTQVLNGVRTPLLNTKFAARWTTSGAGNTGCATDKAGDTLVKSFAVLKLNTSHTFAIYFVTAPAAGTTNELQVTWLP